jgi:hypothetical protein
MASGLFGLVNSNRDFAQPNSWGKNQFNSSFPAALLCYMQSKSLASIYLTFDPKEGIKQTEISTNTLFGMRWDATNIFFGFEQEHVPYGEILVGKAYPIDLVIKNLDTNKYVRALEIKLTAIPDSTTYDRPPELQGAEIVVRTPTIAYIAASICLYFKAKRHILRNIIGVQLDSIQDWSNSHEVLLQLPKMLDIIREVGIEMEMAQTPLIVQPIWKTKGKSPILETNCLDVFVWSDIAFLRLLVDRVGPKEFQAQQVNRPIRTVVWIAKMLFDFNRDGLVNAGKITDQLSFGPKTDKAIALSGNITSKYLKGEILVNPRVSKFEITKIILGDGIKHLSPERRFDSSIVNDPELYENS